jgi:hypothetical protein
MPYLVLASSAGAEHDGTFLVLAQNQQDGVFRQLRTPQLMLSLV